MPWQPGVRVNDFELADPLALVEASHLLEEEPLPVTPGLLLYGGAGQTICHLIHQLCLERLLLRTLSNV